MIFFSRLSNLVRNFPVQGFLFFLAVLYSGFILWSFQAPLVGVHFIRQADTLFTAYSYCTEGASFLYPRIIHRENTSGISIGEFPLWSYILSLPCKITGVWSDRLPNYISFLLFLCNILIWWRVFQKILSKYIEPTERDSLFSDFFVLIFFSSLALTHWTIPLPDVFSLFLAGLGISLGISWRKQISLGGSLASESPISNGDHPQKSQPSLGKLVNNFGLPLLSAFFILSAFAVRPYIAPVFLLLLPLESRSLRQLLSLKLSYWVFLCGLAVGALTSYWGWYHVWKTKSEILYYNTSLVSPIEIWNQFSFVIKGLWNHVVRSELHFIGLLAFFYILLKDRFMRVRFEGPELRTLAKDPWTLLRQRFFWLALFSLVFVLLFKGPHFVNHGYYLLAHFIFFVYFFFCVVQMLPQKIKSGFLVLYALIGIANTSFLFNHSSLKEQRVIQNLLTKHNVGENEKVVAYLGEESNTTYHLYYAKRMGWSKAASDSSEACPEGAQWKLFEQDKVMKLEPCANSMGSRP